MCGLCAVSQDFLKWAVNEENRALQDVANQLAELNLLWTEVQREFGGGYFILQQGVVYWG